MATLAAVIPFERASQVRPVKLRGERVSFSADQLKAFLAAAKEYGVREYAMFVVGFSHGLRVSEIADLRLSDLSLERGQIQVRRLKGSVGTLQSFVRIEGFDEKAAIEAYLRARPQVNSDIVFVSRKSAQFRDGAETHQLNRSQIFRLFRIICERAGIEERFAHPHTLKHSLGQILYDQGVDLSAIQARLGHKNINSTTQYAKPTQDQTHSKVEAVLATIF